MNWYWCDIGYACFGFATKNNKIVVTPPIFKWTLGKDVEIVKEWLVKRRAKIVKL